MDQSGPSTQTTGRVLQEIYDDQLRRDSPTSSPELELHGADVIDAVRQSKKIDRELYFKVPLKMGKCTLPDVEEGDLLMMNKSTYGL
eukprot:6629940-Heterocapsa_arctica.AAC.1